MTSVKYLLALVLVVMASACSDTRPGQSSKSLPDNQENRVMEAKRFIEVMPPKQMLHEVTTRVAPTLPEKDRKLFIDIMNKKDIEEAANRITLAGLTKNFTPNELEAMISFYGSPDGQSAYKKFPSYMGEIMPQIQQEVRKSLEEARKQQQPQEPEKPKAQPESSPQPEQKAPPQGKQ